MGGEDENKKFYHNYNFKNKYLKYKKKYLDFKNQIGGSTVDDEFIKLSNLKKSVKEKYLSLIEYLGEPYSKEIDQNNELVSAIWMEPLDNVTQYDKFNGLDYIKLLANSAKKYHPHKAIVYIIVGKYMIVPEHLYGPLSYASETINIEKLLIPKGEQEKYYENGLKYQTKSLVTGSCASVTISAITIAFVERMIKLYGKCTNLSLEYYELFRAEYDKDIHTYLCGGGINPSIEWYDPKLFGEEAVFNMGEEKCKSYIVQNPPVPECK